MNEGTLLRLSDEEFEDELRENLWPKSEDWVHFVNQINVRRTVEILEGMLVNVEAQIDKHGEERIDWYRRAVNFRRLVTMRIKHANRAIQASEGSHTERERKLRAFAHELVAALDGSNHEFMLDEIFFPFSGKNEEPMSAGDWYDRRLEKRAAEAAERSDNVISLEQALDAIMLEAAA